LSPTPPCCSLLLSSLFPSSSPSILLLSHHGPSLSLITLNHQLPLRPSWKSARGHSEMEWYISDWHKNKRTNSLYLKISIIPFCDYFPR
jgi:hypothetical protein